MSSHSSAPSPQWRSVDGQVAITEVAAPARRRGLDSLIALVALGGVALMFWTMHARRGGGLGMTATGSAGGDVTASYRVPASFGHNLLQIPSQKVKAPIDPESVDPQGYLGIPADIQRVGYYTGGGPLDGTKGSLLVTGHVNWVGLGTGALGRIGELHKGDVVITRGKGKPQAWRVKSLVSYLKSRGLPQDIFRADGTRVLTLVTCGGVLENGNYNANIVVQLQPVKTIVT